MASIEIPYHQYKAKKKNKRAETSIIRWAKDYLNALNYVPLYIERDKNGSAIEDTTEMARIKIWTKNQK